MISRFYSSAVKRRCSHSQAAAYSGEGILLRLQEQNPVLVGRIRGITVRHGTGSAVYGSDASSGQVASIAGIVPPHSISNTGPIAHVEYLGRSRRGSINDNGVTVLQRPIVTVVRDANTIGIGHAPERNIVIVEKIQTVLGQLPHVGSTSKVFARQVVVGKGSSEKILDTGSTRHDITPQDVTTYVVVLKIIGVRLDAINGGILFVVTDDPFVIGLGRSLHPR